MSQGEDDLETETRRLREETIRVIELSRKERQDSEKLMQTHVSLCACTHEGTGQAHATSINT